MLRNREVPIWLEEGKHPADSEERKQAAEETLQTSFTYLWENHWKKLTCSTICRKHGISVELVWNHENSISIPYRGSFKFHNTYAETGYKLWN